MVQEAEVGGGEFQTGALGDGSNIEIEGAGREEEMGGKTRLRSRRSRRVGIVPKGETGASRPSDGHAELLHEVLKVIHLNALSKGFGEKA